MTTDRITWKSTRRRMAADRRRLLERMRARGERIPSILLFRSSYLCIWIHRLAHYCERRGRRTVARLLWQLGLFLTGADISPRSDLGGGLVIESPTGIALCGNAGRNLTVMALCGIGGELSEADIGAGPGLPVLGDDVTIGALAGILGPVRVGDGVRVMPGCVVTRDVPDGHEVVAPRVRTIGRAVS